MGTLVGCDCLCVCLPDTLSLFVGVTVGQPVCPNVILRQNAANENNNLIPISTNSLTTTLAATFDSTAADRPVKTASQSFSTVKVDPH